MPALKFSLRSIGAKLALMTLVGAICMVMVASTALWTARNQLVTERVEKAHAAVDIVWKLADGYYKAYKAGQMTEEEAKKRFLEANNNVWYEDRSINAYLYENETELSLNKTN